MIRVTRGSGFDGLSLQGSAIFRTSYRTSIFQTCRKHEAATQDQEPLRAGVRVKLPAAVHVFQAKRYTNPKRNYSHPNVS